MPAAARDRPRHLFPDAWHQGTVMFGLMTSVAAMPRLCL